jgi:hypothetical protein
VIERLKRRNGLRLNTEMLSSDYGPEQEQWRIELELKLE